MTTIPYACPYIDDDDRRAVMDVLRGTGLADGRMVERFERTVAEYVGAAHAIAFNSATSALQCAYRVTLGYDHWVGVPTITFVATANMLHEEGYGVYFIDVDEYICAVPKLRENIVPVHFAGHPAFRAFGYPVADGAHALGSSWKGRKIGGGENGMTVFSTHAIKNITTGEGGILTTNDGDHAEQLRLLRSHGRKDGKQVALGFNYRMTDIQAALGLSQMGKIDQFKRRKQEIVAHYNSAFRGLPIQTPLCHPDADVHWHLYYIQIAKRDTIRVQLHLKGIGMQINYLPVYREPWWKEYNTWNVMGTPNAEAYYSRCLSIPLHNNLLDEQVEYIAESVKECVAEWQ